MRIGIEEIISGLYVEILSHQSNKVKLNKLYQANKEMAYMKMKKSEINEYRFVKQGSIKKKTEYKKAIGLIEMLRDYESSIDIEATRKLDMEGRLDSDTKLKTDFMNEIGMIILSSFKGLQDALQTNDFRDIAVRLAKTSKLGTFGLEFAITGLLYCRNSDEFRSVFGDMMADHTRELLFRMIECDRIEIGKTKDATELRDKYLPNKKFIDFYKLGIHIRGLQGLDKRMGTDSELDRFFIGIQSISEIYNIDLDSLVEEHNLSRDDVNSVFAYLGISRLESEKYRHLFSFIGFMIVFLCKEINRSKDLFFENNDEIYELEKKVVNIEGIIKDKRISELESALREKDREIDRLKKEYRIGLEREIVDLDRSVSQLERVIDELESRGVQVIEQDIVQVYDDAREENINEYRENITDTRDTINMGHVAVATDTNIVYTDEIYIIGGYSRLISRLKSKFVNLIYDDKGFNKYVGKDNVFILTGYMSHADYYKIDSLGIKGNFVNSKGYNGIVREIVGYIEG